MAHNKMAGGCPNGLFCRNVGCCLRVPEKTRKDLEKEGVIELKMLNYNLTSVILQRLEKLGYKKISSNSIESVFELKLEVIAIEKIKFQSNPECP